MSVENQVKLEVDHYRRIGVKDVITMLKGLRSESVIKIVKSSEISKDPANPDINNKSGKMSHQNITTKHEFNNSPSVKGNTNIPQIRELNEIAALLRSMDIQQRQCSS